MMTNEDEPRSALEHLAERYGILSRYEDAYGKMVTVPAQTLTLLLDAMGLHIKDDADAQSELDALERQAATEVLPPTIVVVPEQKTCSVLVRGTELPAVLEWHMVLEDGSERFGKISRDTAVTTAEGLVLPLPDVQFGYHHLRLPQLESQAHLIVTPGKCWLPPREEHWGIAVQLYLMRSENNWGIGDFADLKALVEMAGSRGCGFVGLNPLHQMFLDDPEAASPYSPATRLFLNPLYIAVPALPEWQQSEPAQALFASADFFQMLSTCRAAPQVDYAGAAHLKISALQLLYETFELHALPERKAAFSAFRAKAGRDLQRASLFQVLRVELVKQDPANADWRNWPDEMQNVGSAALEEFAARHRAELDFQDWLQFVADEQLSAAAEAARNAGMAIGLYRDLAVGSDAAGAETWANPIAFLQRTLVGAPPDIFNPAGQNWGLPPLDPVALAQEGFRSFAELIRANMAHSGGLRIDHVMGLLRLFCIPQGKGAAEGAYVRFPLDSMIGVLALESKRQQCLVVGEDLGTVPPGFRDRMAAANILSYRVLFFEQDFETVTFFPPQDYPKNAFATTGSHDLPTLLAWWAGEDLLLKKSLGLFGGAKGTRSQEERREREKVNILKAFSAAGLPAPEQPSELSAADFAQLAHQYLGMTSSLLIATQLDDMSGDVAPVNVPGTSTEHANWRRKYRLSLEQLAKDDEPWSLVSPLSRVR